MLDVIYEAFIADSLISSKVGGRIKFYEYPETADMTKTHIVIDPLDTPKPSDFADNKWLMEDFMFQIEVWSKNKTDRDMIAKRIQYIMWDLNFGNDGSGVDEYDSDLSIYRDARRYRGKSYVI
ncbi:hypothetical protein SAMN05216232_1989 [Virgibacillus subterraneus]|uniref:DUF3168 domain-containing protein n=1 Tax=Virgibacillus subterraneus TaxID=621109 RepID=A0A1H9EDI1_9BACI|nr:hypothetical protein [Virgibacillus subterraneus]SEQ23637.1 hypothetical protein SAMN05216232_1989 [Virgibacillus subterraneus]